MEDSERQTFNPDAVELYLRQVRRWKEEMLVLVHMSAGAPARATELVSIQQVNSENARCHVHRFVPQEVGELVVYYLWLIEPFVRILQSSRG
jgi:hypothetical protein